MHQDPNSSALREGPFCWLSSFLLIVLSSIPMLELPVFPQDQALSAPKEPASRPAPFPGGRFRLERGDVVAFLGGADVVAAQETGHIEALLTTRYRDCNAHFRNFGWEGDTVFAQPRDFGFPPLRTHLERAGATVIVLQFGRAEALQGGGIALGSFMGAYQKLLDQCASPTPRLVLVTPPPFEKSNPLMPDLALRNSDLAQYVAAIRKISRQRRLPLVDLFSELGGDSPRGPRLTDHGLQLTPKGHAFLARAFAQQLGFGDLAQGAGEPDERGAWPNRTFEQLRQTIIAKNRLWFNYWRPQNWAFLGGDRISQPSSRDYRNPQIRWFPAEMEKYVPLIEAKEREIANVARMIP